MASAPEHVPVSTVQRASVFDLLSPSSSAATTAIDNSEGRRSRSSRLVSHHFNDHSSPAHAAQLSPFCRVHSPLQCQFLKSQQLRVQTSSIPFNDMSQAKEFGWRLLAAETIFHSYDSSMVSKKRPFHQNGTLFQSHFACSFPVLRCSVALIIASYRYYTVHQLGGD